MDISGYGSNTLTVTGGGNQFVVVYKFSGATDSASGAGGPPEGVPFGSAAALNNTDPNFDFSTLDQGKVYSVQGGGADTTIEGGNKQFVVEYTLPASADMSADMGGNSVSVEGGNNKLVVAYEFPGGTASGGNSVSIDGGSNQFVVDYKYAAPVSGSDGGAPAVSFAGADGQSSDNSGVTASSPGGNSVTVNGDHNQYAIQYGNSTSGNSGAAGGNPFGGSMGGSAGGNPFGGSMDGSAGGNPFGGSMSAMGAMSNDDLTALIKQSPFGVLLGLPGVNSAADIFGNVGGSGSNPFAGGGSGANPLAGAAPGQNPFAGFAPGGASASPAGAMPDTSVPADPSNPDYAYNFMDTGASGSAGAASGGAPAMSDGSAGGGMGGMAFDSSMLAASPFGALLQIPGFTTDDIANIFAGSNNGGGNPFAIAGNASGSPFDLGAAITSMADSLAAAPPSDATTGILTEVQTAAGVVANDASVPAFASSFASGLDTQVTQILASQGS